jgi:hypothetical protein
VLPFKYSFICDCDCVCVCVCIHLLLLFFSIYMCSVGNRVGVVVVKE